MFNRRLLNYATIACNTTNCDTGADIGISVMALSLGVILAISVAANGVVCFVFYKKPNLLSVSNSFVLNLSVCQLVLSVLVLPFTLTSVFSSGWIFNDTWCKMQGYIYTVCIVGIQLSLTVIALDRNYAIINSLRYIDVFTQRLANILIASGWILSLILSVPPLIGWGNYSYVENQFTCSINWEQTEGFLVFFSVVCFLIPLLVQSFCYLSIFKAAISHTKRSNRVFPSMPSTIKEISSSVQNEPPSDSSDLSDVSQSIHVKYRNMECKAVRTILLIAFAYTVCWIPYFIVSFARLCSFSVEYYEDSMATSFLFLTGIINPVIYVFMNRVTRHEINKFFCDTNIRNIRKSSSIKDSDDVASTTITTNFSSNRNNGSSSSGQTKSRSSSLTRTDSTIKSVVEMKTIKEELEIEDVIESIAYVEPPSAGSSKEYECATKNELFLDPGELYLQRKKIRSKQEKLMSIKEETTDKRLPCFQWKDFEDVDIAWNPSSCNEKRSKRQLGTNCFIPKRDETFSKRTKRDYGSFLYFENSAFQIQHSRKTFERFGRLSVDETSFGNVNKIRHHKFTRHRSFQDGMNKSVGAFLSDQCRSTSPPVILKNEDKGEIAGSDTELSRILRMEDVDKKTPISNIIGERNCMSA